jgi:hypothetical protein
MNPLPPGTPLKIRIVHREECFEALATVPYSQPSMGMGLHRLASHVDGVQRGVWRAGMHSEVP